MPVAVRTVRQPRSSGGGGVEHLVRAASGVPAVAGRHPGQHARDVRRRGAQRLGVQPDPRAEAADQRDEQQQVDGGEPGRGEDVEQEEPVEHWRQRGVRLEVVLDGHRVQPALGQERTGDAGQGQQEQQQQRGAHAGELPPGAAQRGEQAGATGRGRGQRGRRGGQPGVGGLLDRAARRGGHR
jgi:hypothetical protein